ncbi:hypothetical protein WOLCODRAFT_161867 [Wolfiporia cocos MD-104 SS10]|uniref:F-box domain-containing protein n=1 Tax=Wolfiporia cocos (strain MD-104) TaxID=742152 RepID=A0A2H3JD23_WOLCO|nr:hypothetical protein WOLCODRAFT_161867 [Wolfiporia cocos MD-104 SS10]
MSYVFAAAEQAHADVVPHVRAINMTPADGDSIQNTHASAVLHRRARIEAEIARLNQTILDLKSELNTLAPISALPPEILAKIFIACVDEPESGFTRGRCARIRLTHVCSHWRSVALQSSALWTDLALPAAPALVQEFLARSKSLPLRLYVYSEDYHFSLDGSIASMFQDCHPSLYESMASILKEMPMSRIRTIRMKAVSPASSRRLYDNLDGPAPLLESVELDNRTPYQSITATSSGLPLPPFMHNGHPERLRRLVLKHHPFRWIDIASYSLGHLTISCNLTPAGKGNHMQDFLHAIESMPLLETLDMENAIPSLPSSMTELPRPTSIIPLTRLHSMRLSDISSSNCANILNHFSFPALSTLNLSVRMESELFAEKLAGCLREKVPFWDKVRTLKCSMSEWSFPSLQMQTSPSDCSGAPHAPGCKLDFELTDELIILGPWILSTMCREIPWKQVQTLQVSGLSLMSVNGWIAAFEGMEHVTVLNITGDGGVRHLIDALGHFTPVSGTSTLFGTPVQDTVSMKLFPRLRVITLEGVRIADDATFDEGGVGEVTDKLLNCIMMRYECGVEIHTLRITRCINIDKDDIAKLDEVMPGVDWDAYVYAEEPEYEYERSGDEDSYSAYYDSDYDESFVPDDDSIY